MAKNNDLVVTAGLNIEASTEQIKTELGDIGKDLSDKKALKITCHIDSASVRSMQTELSKATKNQAKAFTDAFNLKLPRGQTAEVRKEIQELINEYKKFSDLNDSTGKENTFKALVQYMSQFERETKIVNEELESQKRIINELAKKKGQVVDVSAIYGDLEYSVGKKNADKSLTSLFGGRNRWTLDSEKGTIDFDQLIAEINNSLNPDIFKNGGLFGEGKFAMSAEGVAQILHVLTEESNELNEAWDKTFGQEQYNAHLDDVRNKLNEIVGSEKEVVNEAHKVSEDDDFLFDMEELDFTEKKIEEIKNDVREIVDTERSLPSVGAGIDTKSTLEDAKTVLNDFFQENKIDGEATRIKRAVEDTTGELKRFYVQVERGDKSIETLTYALNEQGDAYEYLGKTIREADNSTDFRRKGLDVQKQLQTENLAKFEAQVEKSGVATDNLKERISLLWDAISKIDDTNGMNAFLDDLDIAKAQFQALNAEARKENFASQLSNKIKKLSADMQAYAAANKRAIDSTKQMSGGQTFANEWNRLTTEMAKGAKLTDNEVKKLSAEFRIFGKEAEAAGLKGAGAFEKFGNAFKLISTYISANQVINLVTRNIRSAVDELKAVDDRLTEISKTSERTVQSLRNLGESSFGTASKYGRTASDYLLGVQEMSRAGFGEKASEDMAELSVLAQAAGDMTAELANEYLIATNAAYQYNGSVEKLNDSLDRQNYVTNHYALSMSDLAEATKIAASQAAQSGIGIDEMTAALSTMIATTQQGGEIAARSLRGILMNIQQVKGAVGDGEEDITAESLSKYEKAAADLGVSLKEVRNGAVSLRDPMIVLDELATAFNKEAEDSIKKANLISAIGGKYRGNQLSALLSNWDTYKDILNTFNADQAAGSAMEEAEKSANNWAGSLNKVKNSWAELVNEFINSENAITVIQSLNKIIQNLTDSATTGSLKTLSDAITSLIKLVGDLTESFGTLPTIITSIAAVSSFKGGGFFGGDVGKFSYDLKQLIGEIDQYNRSASRANYVQKTFGKEIEKSNTPLNTYLKGLNGAQGSIRGYITSLVSARLKTIALELATAALNATITFGLSLAIEGIIKAFDKLIVTEKEAQENQQKLREEAEQTAAAYKESNNAIDNWVEHYSKIANASDSLINSEKELSSLQDELIEKYGEKAEKLDLINQKYSDGIEAIQKFKLEEAKEYVERADRTKSYERALERNTTKYKVTDTYSKGFYDTGSTVMKATGVGGWDFTKENIKLLNSWDNIYWDNGKTGYGEQFRVTGTLEEQKKTLQDIADIYGSQKKFNDERLDSLNAEIEKLDKEIQQNNEIISTYENAKKIISESSISKEVQADFDELLNKAQELNQELNSENTSTVRKYAIAQELLDVKNELNNIAGSNSNLRDIIDATFSAFNTGLSTSIESIDNLRTAWFESLDDIQKGSLKNIDTMKSALQSIMNGENISSDTFWQLSDLDTDHILNGVKMVGDEFQLTEEQIISLKDTYIKKQMESIQLRQTELKQLKSAEEMETRQLQVALDNWKFADKNLNNPKYRAEFEDLQNRLKTAKENAAAYGDEWSLNAILLRQYNASLGNTADLIQAAQSRAEKLSEAFVGRIDKVIDGINDQKDALTEEKEVLQDQLDVLEAQADEIKSIIEDYEKVADVVKTTIQDEISAIEESYNKQIEALKAQNEEREEAINLTEKLNNLNNAKNNKVVTYTEAGGFQYGVNKEAVNKAQQEYDKALIDSQIAKLEKERDSATAGFEEYAKLWENATKKATKAEEEELAARILGADWREKISEQDVEIFETYEQKYDEYGVSLNNITKIEIANVKKSIEAKDKEIKAKEDLLKEWQKYKTNVQNYVNDLKNTNKEYEDSIEDITLTESSNLDERLANFERFKTEYESMINRILELQDGVGDIEVNASVKMDDFTDGIKEVVEGIGTVSEKLAEAIKELGKMPTINSAGDVKYYQATGYQHYASGGVNSSTGLAWLDGTRSKPEVVLNNQDATKLYNLLHSMPASAAQMFSSPLTRFAGLRSGNTSQSSAITITGNTINLPNVRDPQQFAREMERYLQTTLTESQIIPPRS